MYGFAPDADLSFFRGEELIQVRVGANETQLAFTGRILVNTGCRVTVRRDRSTVISDDSRILGAALYDFLTETVSEVGWDVSGTLRLEFGDMGTVTVEDDAGSYESYQIYRGKDVIVV